MARWLIAAILVLAAALFVFGGDLPRALAVAGAVGGLVAVPGYLASLLLLPRGSIDRLERIVIGLGSGIVVVMLTGLLLNLTPVGVGPVGWAALIGGSLLLLALAWRASHRGWRGFVAMVRTVSTPQLNQAQVVALVASLALVATAIAVSRLSEARLHDVEITQLWAVSSGATPGDVSASIEVGVRNLENQRMPYRVVATAGGRTLATWTPTLDDGDTWTTVLRIVADEVAPIEVQLFRPGGTEAYRTALVRR